MAATSEVRPMDPDAARKFLAQGESGAYTLLDVRQPQEYEEMHIPGATLVPLPELSDRFRELDPSKPTLVYCRSGKRGGAAAEMLAGRGFAEVYNLTGGILAWQDEIATGGLEQGLACFVDATTSLQILAAAYAMEENLGDFYAELAGKAEGEAQDVYRSLVRMEDGHKAMVLNMAKRLDASVASADDLLQGGACALLEGGFTSDEFLAQNAAALAGQREAVEAGMAFESQALDLYLRLADRQKDAAVERVCRELAREEQKHLATLGRLLEKTEEK